MTTKQTIGNVNKKDTLQDSNWCFTTLSSLLNDSSTHDIAFKTSDGGRVSAHRAIVAAGSPVFHAMLYGNMKESNDKEIALPSVDTATFKTLVLFMYTGKIEIDSENCFSILEATHYFNVAVLENKCVDFITSLLNIESCCTIAIFANDKRFDGLLEKCLAFMYSNAYNVTKDPSFKNMPSELMLKFCQSSDLCIREIDLFTAAIEWYRHHKANLSDKTIKKIFQQIRYPLIPVSDLLEKVRPTKIADSTLYTLALEFHHMPNKYDGPKIQLVRRKSKFDFINLTTDTVTIHMHDSRSIIEKSRSNDWNGLCAAQVDLTENTPVHFKFLLNKTNTDHSGIQIVVKSCLKGNLSANSYRGSIDVSGFTTGKEVDGVIIMKGNQISTTIGHKTMTTTKQHDTIYLCVHLYYFNNSVTFS